MADPNVQAQTPLTLSGGNDATNRYMNYYNQIKTQLVRNQNPATIQAQTIELPREMQAQQISAPERIQAERLATEDRTYGDYANEVASYLNPYLQNAIRSRRDQTADYRAAADADAWSRGMGGSTYLSDQKNQLAKAEARDIMAAQNEFLANVGQQAFSALQNQYNRNLQANMQNAANALAVDQFNANLANAVNQFNANALMQTDQYNIDNLLRVAMQNAANTLAADQFNANAMNDWTQMMEQIATGWANQMYGLNPYVESSGGGGGLNGQGGVTTIPQSAIDAANNTLGLARNAATSIADTVATNLMNNPFGVLGGVKNGKTANTTPGKTTSAAGKNLNYVAR
jgi:hypothetical protein